MPNTQAPPPHEQYIIDVLLNCAPGSVTSKSREHVPATPDGIQPCPGDQKGVPLVVPVLLTAIEGISHLRIFVAKDLRPLQARETVWKSLLEVHRRVHDSIALLDPIGTMGIKDEKFSELIQV